MLTPFKNKLIQLKLIQIKILFFSRDKKDNEIRYSSIRFP